MLRCMGAAAPSEGGESYIKCVAVGDGRTGKTYLLISYAQNTFSSDYAPTVLDNIRSIVLVDGDSVNLSLWDTAGQKEYNRVRPLSYRGSDVFLVLFSLINKGSYGNIQKKWVPELRHYAGNVPIVLVGTVLDMRDDKQFFRNNPNLEPVSTAQGEELKTTIGAAAYIECSAKTKQNVAAVFNSAITAALCKPKNKQKQNLCSIM